MRAGSSHTHSSQAEGEQLLSSSTQLMPDLPDLHRNEVWGGNGIIVQVHQSLEKEMKLKHHFPEYKPKMREEKKPPRHSVPPLRRMGI
jgi:hypothetical protein